MLFIKCGGLKREGIHKDIFAAAPSGLTLCGLQQPASDSLPSERFADEKESDAKPIAKGLSRQSGCLFAAFVLQKYADGNVLRRLAVAEILFF